MAQLLLLVAAVPCLAQPVAAEGEAAPALDARVRLIANELRCVVCQNQTLADSNAALAVDLRNEIRAQLRRGATDAQVQEFLVSRYGEFVLYRPAFRPGTAALWGGPFVLLALGGWALFSALRRQALLPVDAARPEIEGL
ncbi:MAG TPA: cytochrome c-type biogenesis protein [Burkholderiaceae bacterium]|nr:cytochrome c-type biogenesis protein [Burkholderiaceae bacterium]